MQGAHFEAEKLKVKLIEKFQLRRSSWRRKEKVPRNVQRNDTWEIKRGVQQQKKTRKIVNAQIVNVLKHSIFFFSQQLRHTAVN